MALLQLEINSKFKHLLILFLALLVLSGTVLTIWSMNRLATVGEQLAGLEKSKSSLQLENQLLENKIAEKKSLSTIEQESKQLGFEKIKQMEYVSDSGIALNH